MLIEHILRKLRAMSVSSLGIPPDPLDCRRPPRFGKSLPVKMGAGGWPIEEPTQEELDGFLRYLREVPLTYFGPYQPDSADYGSEYTCVIVVKQWLKLISDSRLLVRDDLKERL